MELERIKVAFARELESRGLNFAARDGHLLVQITVYHREASMGIYHYPEPIRYMEQAVAIDLFDNATRKHVWHCAAVGDLEYDPQKRASGLPELVAKIFEDIPSRFLYSQWPV